MKTNIEKGEKICWACKRTLVVGSKFGLCPDCLNKYGSPVVAGLGVIGIGGIGFIGRKVLTNGGKVAKGVIDVIKLIKS